MSYKQMAAHMTSLMLVLLLTARPSLAQLWQPAKLASSDDYLSWSATRRLQARDFRYSARPRTNLKGSIGQFGFLMQGTKYDLLGKKGNSMVHNVLYRAGSYLDTTDQRAIGLHLLYLQTLWDINEVAARRLRQELRAAAKNIILWGRPDPNQLIQIAYEAASKRQLQYADETNYGLYLDKQAAWEKQLAAELTDLQSFAIAD